MVEQYLRILLDELEDLETISNAKLYSGEFHIADLSKFRVNLPKDRSQCAVFVDYEGGPFEDNPVDLDKNYIMAGFTIYVVGYTDKDKDSVGFSSSCVKCSREINRLVQHKEFHKISGVAVGYSKPIQQKPMLNGIKKGNATTSLHIYQYEQRMSFDYE